MHILSVTVSYPFARPHIRALGHYSSNKNARMAIDSFIEWLNLKVVSDQHPESSARIIQAKFKNNKKIEIFAQIYQIKKENLNKELFQ